MKKAQFTEEAIRTSINEEVIRIGYRPLSHRDISNHPDDWYLKAVYGYKDRQDGLTEYAVWLYNAEYNGLSEGYYTTDREAAMEKYMNKR